MKLLRDQNLSHRLVRALSDDYPDSSHVAYLSMGTAVDIDIWTYAQEHGYAVVTQDADFHEYSLLHGGPPLVIWLKCGNQRKQVILDKLRHAKTSIEQAVMDSEIWCLEIY